MSIKKGDTVECTRPNGNGLMMCGQQFVVHKVEGNDIYYKDGFAISKKYCLLIKGHKMDIQEGDSVWIKTDLKPNTMYGVTRTDTEGKMVSMGGQCLVVTRITSNGRVSLKGSDWVWTVSMFSGSATELPATLESMRKERIRVLGMTRSVLITLNDFLFDIKEEVLLDSEAFQEGQNIHTTLVVSSSTNIWCGGGTGYKSTIGLSDFLEKYAHLLPTEKPKPKEKEPVMFNPKPCIINYNIKDKNKLAMQVARNVHMRVLANNHVNADIIEAGYTQIASAIHTTMIDAAEYKKRVANWDIKYIALWDICKKFQDAVHNPANVGSKAELKASLMHSWYTFDRYIKKPAKDHSWMLGVIKNNLVADTSVLYKSNNIIIRFNKTRMFVEMQVKSNCYNAALQYKTGEFSL